MILAQRVQEGKSTGVLSRLFGSGEILLFMYDSVEVISRPIGRRGTRELKTIL